VLRRVRVVYWPMDLNPDQAVALGFAREGSLSVRLLEWLNRAVLRRADVVIALDRAMARRLERKRPIGDKLVIVPPWAEEDAPAAVPPQENPFRVAHGLIGKRVIMYAGTLGLANPVTTLLKAAERFEDRSDLVFLFVGGGAGMSEVRARNRPNVRWLPYQPFEQLPYSLSAGDVHVVSLGDDMAGIVHPCKVYGAMARGRPVLYVGPPHSHVTEMLDDATFGWQVRHGDVAGAVGVIREILEADGTALEQMGEHGRKLVERDRTRSVSCGRVCDAIEGGARPGGKGEDSALNDASDERPRIHAADAKPILRRDADVSTQPAEGRAR